MVYAYLCAAILGVVLLLAGIAGGAHDHDAGHDAGGEHASPAAALLSVRTWTYLLAFGGLTGLLLRYAAPVAEPWRAVLSLGVGVAASALARGLIGRAARAGPSGTVKAGDLVGRTGGVLVPFGAGAAGKVRVRVAEADVDLVATTDDGESLKNGDEVLIVEVKPDHAVLVTRAPR